MFTLFFYLFCQSIQKHSYAVAYGSSKAKYKLVSYFDIGCTHCVEFYRHIFPIIKKNFCNKGKLLFIYKPYPVHQETLTYMSFCTVLNKKQKQALFETLMALDIPITADIMCECMKALKTSCPALTSDVLHDAFSLKKRCNFENLPAMFFNKKRLNDDEQDHIIQFLEENMKNRF